MSLSKDPSGRHCPVTMLPPFRPSSPGSDTAVYRPSTAFTLKYSDVTLAPLHPSADSIPVAPIPVATVPADPFPLRAHRTNEFPQGGSALPSLSILGLLSLPTTPPPPPPPPARPHRQSDHPTAISPNFDAPPPPSASRGSSLSTMSTTTVTTTSCMVSVGPMPPTPNAQPATPLSPAQTAAGPAPVKIQPTPINAHPAPQSTTSMSPSGDKTSVTSGLGQWLTVKTLPLADGKLYASTTATATNIVNPPPMTSCLAFSSPACPSTMTTTTLTSSSASASFSASASTNPNIPFPNLAGPHERSDMEMGSAPEASPVGAPVSPPQLTAPSSTPGATGRVWSSLANSLPPHLQLNVARKLQRLKPYQRYNLERIFQTDPYPSSGSLKKLSAQLDLPIAKIQVWFTNRRAKMKRDAWARMQVHQVDD